MTISKNNLKYYSSLRIKKFRDSENKFIAEGKKNIDEGLKSKFILENIFVTAEFEKENKNFLDDLLSKKINSSVLTEHELKKLTDTKTPQGVAAVFIKTKITDLKKLSSNNVVCLDNISDPGNVGTIIRNCDWFGIKEIILSEGCADIYNPKTLRASMGSIFHATIFENISLQTKIKSLKKNGYEVCCSDLSGENIFDFTFPEKKIIIFSNEANGPSRELLEIADAKITIPKYGKAESLNVASASAIILSQIVNQ